MSGRQWGKKLLGDDIWEFFMMRLGAPSAGTRSWASRPIAVPLQVTYNVNSFIDKNNDLLFRDLSQAMWKAQHPLLRSLFPEGDPKQASLKRPPTAGAQFKSSVAILMKNLYSKNPNYIR